MFKAKKLLSISLLVMMIFTAVSSTVNASDHIVAADIWLLFDIDQTIITSETTKLTGSVGISCNDTVLKVYISDKVVAEKELPNNCEPFAIDVDFSKYKDGDSVVISREFVGTVVDMPGYSVAVHNQSKTFTISTVITLEEPVPTSTTETKITLNKSKVTIKKRKKFKLKAKISASNAQQKIIWTVSPKKILSAGKGSKTVTFKALKKGTATVKAKINNGKTAKCTVKVK